MDKDSVYDDLIGQFQIDIADNPSSVRIMRNGKEQGHFFLQVRHHYRARRTPTNASSKIKSQPSLRKAESRLYIFDGPVRFMRCKSHVVGKLIGTKTDHDWVTHKIYLKGVYDKFKNAYQGCVPGRPVSQFVICGSLGKVLGNRMHSVLYDPKKGDEFGIIWNFRDFLNLLRSPSVVGPSGRVKPMIYTYIISADDDTFRFSETGPALLNDLASKHALHSDCNRRVRYSGEFHPRPKGGWSIFKEGTSDNAVKWELVIDNCSGTYAPNKNYLSKLKELLLLNFNGIEVCTYDRDDRELAESKNACIEYALGKRHIKREDLGLATFSDTNSNS